MKSSKMGEQVVNIVQKWSSVEMNCMEMKKFGNETVWKWRSSYGNETMKNCMEMKKYGNETMEMKQYGYGNGSSIEMEQYRNGNRAVWNGAGAYCSLFLYCSISTQLYFHTAPFPYRSISISITYCSISIQLYYIAPFPHFTTCSPISILLLLH